MVAQTIPYGQPPAMAVFDLNGGAAVVARVEQAKRQHREGEKAKRQRNEAQRKREREETEREHKEAQRKRLEEEAQQQHEEEQRQRKEAQRQHREAEEKARRQRNETRLKREREEEAQRQHKEAERKCKIQHLAVDQETAVYRLCLPGIAETLVQAGAYLAYRKYRSEERVYHPDYVQSISRESLILLKPSSVGLAILNIFSGDPKDVIVTLGNYCAGFWTNDKPGQIEVAVKVNAANIDSSLWRLGDVQIEVRHATSVVLWNALRWYLPWLILTSCRSKSCLHF